MRRIPLTEKMARSSARRPWLTIAAWLVIVVAAGGLLYAFGDSLQAADDFVGRPESKQAEELLAERIPGSDADTEIVVVRSGALTVADAAFEARVRDLAASIRSLGPKDVRTAVTYYDAAAAAKAAADEVRAAQAVPGGADPAAVKAAEAAAGQAAGQAAALVSADRCTTIIPVTMAVPSGKVDEHMAGLYDVVSSADGRQGFTVVVTGTGAWERDASAISENDLLRGEAIGIPIALLILVLVFGSVVAALVPLALGMVAIVIGAALTALLGEGFMVSVFALNIVTMMGLAVGIDYTLFVVSRFREELAAGRSVPDSVGRAAATASRAVLFSGMTVVLALSGMLVVPFTIFTSLGAGAIVVVAAAVAAALTLLPAGLALLGTRVNALRLPLGRLARRGRSSADAAGSPAAASPAGGFWAWTAAAIMRRPVVSLAVGGGILLLLAAPGLGMQRGESGITGLPEDVGTRRGYEILASEFSAGLTSPIQVAIDGDLGDESVAAAVQKLRAAVQADGRFTIAGFQRSDDGRLGLLSLAVDSDGTGAAAARAVHDLRSDVIPAATEGAPVRVLVGGGPAAFADMIDLIDLYTPIVIAAVLLLSCILLLVAFRSLVIAVKAVFMNLLSVGAAFGLLTLVFQKGVGAGLLGFREVGVIESWVPLLLFCILFGLSMDYQVFLLSRIRERFDQCGDTREAVSFGLQSTAGIITGAALIMVAVFAGLAAGEMVMFQEIGFGLAVAVALDATLVRVVVVPSTMALLGRWNWYLPKWLQWLPHVSLDEGTPGSAGRRSKSDAPHRAAPAAPAPVASSARPSRTAARTASQSPARPQPADPSCP
jgi:RND superfamily putative drug exporter